MVKSRKEGKSKGGFSSYSANSDLWFILPAVIFILGGLFFLSDLNERKGVVTGMVVGAVYGGSMPEGYYWDSATPPTYNTGGCDATFCSGWIGSTLICLSPNSVNDKTQLCLTGSDGKVGIMGCGTPSNSVSDGVIYNKFVCNNNKWEVCQQKGLNSDSKFYCDGSKWQVCNVTGKTIQDGTNNYVCNNKMWVKCINKFCIVNPSVPSGWASVDEATPFVMSHISMGGDKVETSSDLNNNQQFYNVLAPLKKEVYFKYKSKNYKVALVAPNYYEGTAKIELNSIDNVLKGSADLKATNESFPYFAPVQIAANLEGDDAPEVYVNVYGTVAAGDSANILVVVSPRLNLDEFSDRKVFLSSGNPQEFTFDGKHTLSLMETLGNYILFIDGKEYTSTQGTHYFEGKEKSENIIYEIYPKSKFTVVKLTKSTGGINKTYEESFSLNKNINAGGKIIKICADDTKSLKQSLEVCDKDEVKQFSLQNKGLNVVGNTLYWYLQPVADEPKEGKAFYLASLPLGASSINETANTFSNNLVQGKRLSLDVDKSYYLLSHAVTAYLDFPSLILTSVSNKDLPQYKAEGDQEKIVFNLPLKRQVNVKLNFEPALNFELSSKTVTDNPVNLIDTLQTSLSTYGSVQLTSPAGVGSVAVDATDIATLKDKMKIAYGGSKTELMFQQPTVLGSGAEKALFYYNSFTSAGLNTFIKYADINLYYNLTVSSAIHTFDDEKFILPLVKGRKIAFGLEGNYYLLSYSEPWTKDSASGFSATKMTLTSLDGTTKYNAQATEGGVAFDVGQRKINVEIDTNKNQITFKGVTAVEAAKMEFNPEKDYLVELPASSLPAEKNVVEIIGVGKFYNCDTPATKKFEKYFLLCEEGKEGTIIVKLNEPILLPEKDPKVVLWYKGKSGNKKTITFQHLISPSSSGESSFEWDALTELLKQEKNPIFAVDGELLELAGDDALETFNLRSVPDGENYLIQMHSFEEGYSNGTIAVDDKLLFLQQNLKDFLIDLKITVLPYKLLTDKEVNLTSDVGFMFVPSVGSSSFNIIATADETINPASNKKLNWYDFEVHGSAQKELDGGTLLFKGIIPAGKSRNILLSNGEQITVTVLSEEDEEGNKIFTPVVKK